MKTKSQGLILLALSLAVCLIAGLLAVGCASTKTVPAGTLVPVGSIVGGKATTQSYVTTQPTVVTTTAEQNVATAATDVQNATAVAAPVAAFVPGWGTVIAGILAGVGAGAGAVKMLASTGSPSPTQVEQATAAVVATTAAAIVPVLGGAAATTAKEVATIAGAIAGQTQPPT